jgi:hypothetical protein
MNYQILPKRMEQYCNKAKEFGLTEHLIPSLLIYIRRVESTNYISE